MTREMFEKQAISLMGTLYYVSYSLLPNPYDQEDAVQECLEKALQKYHTLREDAYFKTWLIRILINACHDIRKKKMREFPHDEIAIIQPAESKGEVFESIMSLSEKHRLPLILHYYEGYTTREIAVILRIPEGTIKSRLKRARELLENLLQSREAFV